MADSILGTRTIKDEEGNILYHIVDYHLEKDGSVLEPEVAIHATEMTTPSDLNELKTKANVVAKLIKDGWTPSPVLIVEKPVDITGVVIL